MSAIVVNSGNAMLVQVNKVKDTIAMANLTAELLIKVHGHSSSLHWVIGLICPWIRWKLIKAAVANLSVDGADCAAEAIMTTDIEPKQVAVEVEIQGSQYVLVLLLRVLA